MGIAFVKNQDIQFIDVVNNEKSDPFFSFNYQGKIFERLNISFNKQKKNMLEAFCAILQKQQKNIVVLDKKSEYLVYSEVNSQSNLQPSKQQEIKEKEIQSFTQNKSQNVAITNNNYYSLASLLILQNMLVEIEDLMGNKRANDFRNDLEKLLQKMNLSGTESKEKIKNLLMIKASVNNNLPVWNSQQVDQLFPKIRDLGKKYFGNTLFVDICLDNIKKLPIYNEPEFMKCCMDFVLVCK